MYFLSVGPRRAPAPAETTTKLLRTSLSCQGPPAPTRRFRIGLIFNPLVEAPTETAAPGDSESQDHAVEALQGFCLPGALRASLAALPHRTSWGTTTPSPRTSPPHVCGSPSRPGGAGPASSARLCAIRTPLRRRGDEVRLFPNGRISTLSVAWCLTAPFSSEGECRSRSASPVSSCQLTARTFDTRRLVVALRLLRHRVSADCPRHPMTRT